MKKSIEIKDKILTKKSMDFSKQSTDKGEEDIVS
jgi:hypothetical protein